MSEDSPTPSFYHNGNKILVEFGYKEVMKDFKSLGLNLLQVLQGDKVLLQIMMDDEVMLQIWWHYVQKYEESFDKAIETLEAKEVHMFKEAFWNQVVNFTKPELRPLLEAMRKEVDKALKSPELILKNSSSDSSEEQVSIQTITR